jgi:ferredoxin
VPGVYYVDSQCIDCDVCRVTAPGELPAAARKRATPFVFRQPESPEENAQCQEAMDSCPVEAIGNDGS